MFMYQKNEAQKEKLEKLFKKVEALYGSVVPQMEFLGNIEVEYLEDFLKEAMRLVKHPNIDFDLFAFIRLHIAFKEDYTYCKAFNTKLLLGRGFIQSQLDDAVAKIGTVPFDEKHRALATFAIKSMYESRLCNALDFEELYKMGWNQKDVFDAVSHAGMILKNGRILTTYSKKPSSKPQKP